MGLGMYLGRKIGVCTCTLYVKLLYHVIYMYNQCFFQVPVTVLNSSLAIIAQVSASLMTKGVMAQPTVKDVKMKSFVAKSPCLGAMWM